MQTIKERLTSPNKFPPSPAKEKIIRQEHTPSLLFLFLLLTIQIFFTFSNTVDFLPWWQKLHSAIYDQTPIISANTIEDAFFFLPMLMLSGALSSVYDKVSLYYLLRLVIASISFGLFAVYYNAVKKRYSGRIALIFVGLLFGSSGLFATASSFSPVSMWMWLGMIVQSVWFSLEKDEVGVGFVGYSKLIFVAVVAVLTCDSLLVFVAPALWCCWRKKGIRAFVEGVVAMGVVYIVTAGFFFLLEEWGLFEAGETPYLFNPTVNVWEFFYDAHITLVVSLFVLIISVFSPSVYRRTRREGDYEVYLYHLGSFLLVVISLSGSERYGILLRTLHPHIILAASVSLTAIFDGVLELLYTRGMSKKEANKLVGTAAMIVVMLIIAISFSRSLSNYSESRALEVFTYLPDPADDISLCLSDIDVPNPFYLPENIKIVESGCNMLIGSFPPDYSIPRGWQVIHSVDVMDIEASGNTWSSNFFIPYYSYRHNQFNWVALLARE